MNKHNTAITLWFVYLAGTLLFYVFFLLMEYFPLISLVGAQTPYYLLLLMMLLAEIPWISGGIHLYVIFIVSVILFAAWFLIASVLLFAKKKYLPFGLFTVTSNMITVIMLTLAFWVIGKNTTIPASTLVSIIGNATFATVYLIATRAADVQISPMDNDDGME